jgi:hypothetical protein
MGNERSGEDLLGFKNLAGLCVAGFGVDNKTC